MERTSYLVIKQKDGSFTHKEVGPHWKKGFGDYEMDIVKIISNHYKDKTLAEIDAIIEEALNG